ncbi:MAG: cupredoxin domain-containing protein [Candidatus Doudnabacteria bacterium]|nr:cupredoxin domain-containing protein [Candidatus Doudnabacteria bacterium]
MKTLVWAIIAVVIVVGAVLLINNNASAPTTEQENVNITEPSPSPTPNPTEVPPPSETPTPSQTPTPAQTPTPNPTTTAPKNYPVSMTDAGFTPATLTIKKGDTVTFTNNGTKAIWPASAPHPTHTDYPEFDPKKQITVGASWSFTFTKVGTWKYHDHLNPTKFGSITVTE